MEDNGTRSSPVRGVPVWAMGKDKSKDDDTLNPLGDFLQEDDEGPTRSLGTLDGAPGAPANPSFASLVASEEALRVFDEMSNPGSEYSVPGGRSVRFGGQADEQSTVQTLAPFADGERGAKAPGLGGEPPQPGAPKLAGAATAGVVLRDGWTVFEHCPCPLFRLDGEGRIQAANLALCQFLGGDLHELLGQELHLTRLGRLYATLEGDIRECMTASTGLQRFLSFLDANQRNVRFLLWIVPMPPEALRSCVGIILPYPGE